MRIFLTFLSFLFLLTSCQKHQGTDALEKDHPRLVEARDLVRIQDVEGAEAVLLEMLREEPEVALTHVQLGMLYQSTREPVKALYHFQAYLEMRPESEKALILEQVVEDERRRLANLSAVAAVPVLDGSPEARILELESALSAAKQTNAELTVKLDQLQQQSGGLGDGPPPQWAQEKLALLERISRLESGTASAVSVSPPVGEPEPRSYTVKRGDTLSRISQKMYGEASQWRKIYEANRERIPNQNALRLGTELVIP